MEQEVKFAWGSKGCASSTGRRDEPEEGDGDRGETRDVDYSGETGATMWSRRLGSLHGAAGRHLGSQYPG